MPSLCLHSSGIPNLLPMENRSPGVHLSDLIHRVCVENNHYEEHSDTDIDPVTGEYTEELQTLLQVGCAFETALTIRYSQQYPGLYIQPGEITLDGIHITADLMNLVPDDRYPDLPYKITEIKCTYMSSAEDPMGPKFWRIRSQLMAQCLAWKTTVGQIAILHLNGDCRGKRRPQFLVWELEFTQQELRENWALLRSYRDGQ